MCIVPLACCRFGSDEVHLCHTHEDNITQPFTVAHDLRFARREELPRRCAVVGSEPAFAQVIFRDLILEILVDPLVGSDRSVAISVDIHVSPEGNQRPCIVLGDVNAPYKFGSLIVVEAVG